MAELARMEEDSAEYGTGKTDTFTKIPNWLFDALADVKSHYAYRVIMVIARKTCGWHKTEDQISYSQFESLTGMSRYNVARGIKAAIESGLVSSRKEGQNLFYSIKVVKAPDQLRLLTSQDAIPVPVKPLDQLTPKVVKGLNTQKKEFKEKKETNLSHSRPLREKYKFLLSELEKGVVLKNENDNNLTPIGVLTDMIAEAYGGEKPACGKVAQLA